MMTQGTLPFQYEPVNLVTFLKNGAFVPLNPLARKTDGGFWFAFYFDFFLSEGHPGTSMVKVRARVCHSPVAEGNCVAMRLGGEQPEANCRSAVKRTRVGGVLRRACTHEWRSLEDTGHAVVGGESDDRAHHVIGGGTMGRCND